MGSGLSLVYDRFRVHVRREARGIVVRSVWSAENIDALVEQTDTDDDL